ncbi:hypothetical protein WJX84_005445 [Apatococcus fuscideae]|uniref:Uncharacterized protein n=1 Tax=Apatococcus fuscideae TaxID=2026836 RepID=A0AAW1TDV9_9CHLO
MAEELVPEATPALGSWLVEARYLDLEDQILRQAQRRWELQSHLQELACKLPEALAGNGDLGDFSPPSETVSNILKPASGCQEAVTPAAGRENCSANAIIARADLRMAWLREFKAAAESKRLELDGEPVAADMVPAVDELALKPRALVYSRLNAAQEKLVEAVLNRDEQKLADDSAFDFATAPAQHESGEASCSRVGADIDAELSSFCSQHGWDDTDSLYSLRTCSDAASTQRPMNMSEKTCSSILTGLGQPLLRLG